MSIEIYKNDIIAFYEYLDICNKDKTNYKNLVLNKEDDYFKEHATLLYNTYKNYNINNIFDEGIVLIDDINISEIYETVSDKRKEKIKLFMKLIFMNAKKYNETQLANIELQTNNNLTLINTLLNNNIKFKEIFSRASNIKNSDIDKALKEIAKYVGNAYDSTIENFILDVLQNLKKIDTSKFDNMQDAQVLFHIIQTIIIPAYKKHNISIDKVKQIVVTMLPKILQKI